MPNRERNTILDLFEAVRIATREDENLAHVLAMLLDFAKAYNSLIRLFLFCGTAIPGMPRQFRAACGNSSREHEMPLPSERLPVAMARSSRCLLAPLLFILTLELIYEKIENTTELEGIVLSSRSKQINVKLCGYADDTAVYFRSPQKVSRVLEILAQFFRHGIQTPIQCQQVHGNSSPIGAVIDPASLGKVKLLRDGEHCKYLGIQLSVGEATKAKWGACISSINARLHLARAKTNTVGQRAALAAAVIVPKLVLVARHVWPPTSTVGQLQHVKRFVWGKGDGKQVRAWMGEMQADLPWRQWRGRWDR
ncbi:hypothetical protein PsorP6_015894 [Peronosclerospora sorghi]|uniref:Uncharacterized protein n=1 Tax=Peronosclerospora sorghi TaxID=230839 RepID=A0ACC0WRJ4_9STRA|nr:hypothetical protein PsorP6_015894 [Peronosclerospora sorghi]